MSCVTLRMLFICASLSVKWGDSGTHHTGSAGLDVPSVTCTGQQHCDYPLRVRSYVSIKRAGRSERGPKVVRLAVTKKFCRLGSL